MKVKGVRRARPLWTCPKCGLKCVGRNMWHSCGRATLADWKARMGPNARDIYDRFESLIARCGEYHVSPAKTRIALRGRIRFAGITKIGEDGVMCNFAMHAPVAMIGAMLIAAQTMIAVPDQVRRDLDATCAGWQLAPVTPEIAEEIKTRTPAWPPNLLPGDFNGDDQVDVAVLIECNGSAQLLAFLSNGSGFSKQVLEKPQPYDAREFLHLIRKEYEHDAVGVEYEAIGGHAWVFRDGRWQSVIR